MSPNKNQWVFGNTFDLVVFRARLKMGAGIEYEPALVMGKVVGLEKGLKPYELWHAGQDTPLWPYEMACLVTFTLKKEYTHNVQTSLDLED